MFKRKVYNKLLEWKNKYSEKYAVMLEGARRVGKSTIAEEFAKNEYKSYILIDFANTSNEVLEIFEDISNLDIFFLITFLDVTIPTVTPRFTARW